MFIGKLDNIVDKCNNTYRTIKIKPTDVKVSKYIDLDVEDKDPKFKVCDHARRSFCCRKKWEILYHGHMKKRTLIVKTFLERFMKSIGQNILHRGDPVELIFGGLET